MKVQRDGGRTGDEDGLRAAVLAVLFALLVLSGAVGAVKTWNDRDPGRPCPPAGASGAQAGCIVAGD